MTEHALVVKHSEVFKESYNSDLQSTLAWPGVDISTIEDRNAYIELASEATKYVKSVVAFFKQTRQPFKNAMDEHRAMEKAEVDVPNKFIAAVKTAIKTWDKEQEKEARELLKAGNVNISSIKVAPKGDKQSNIRNHPTATVVDIKKVCGLIAKGDLPDTLVSFSKSGLNDLAKQWGEDLDKKYPGLEYNNDKTVVIT